MPKGRYLVTIDCGTTNSRVYLVERSGKVLLSRNRKVGVKDTAQRGSNRYLKEQLKELLEEVLTQAKLTKQDIALVLSSGMITSELGIIELPHLFAPTSMDDLASSITRVEGEESFDPEVQLYLIRGIKNPYHPEQNDLRELPKLDFMRGEETQVAGLLRLYGQGISTAVINLSSHTKCIPVDKKDRILGSITTLSGQVFEAILKETMIGKSVLPVESSESIDPNAVPFSKEMAELAFQIVTEAGLLRSLVMPRFMDVLLKTTWTDRRKFLECALAVDDLYALRLFPSFEFPYGDRIFLVGPKSRCEIFTYYLKEKLRLSAQVQCISSAEEVANLSVQGALFLAEKRGLL
ncbi:MAG: 2-dehydro-3-deoxygalactonokinase [Spirochaetales bacterium]